MIWWYTSTFAYSIWVNRHLLQCPLQPLPLLSISALLMQTTWWYVVTLRSQPCGICCWICCSYLPTPLLQLQHYVSEAPDRHPSLSSSSNRYETLCCVWEMFRSDIWIPWCRAPRFANDIMLIWSGGLNRVTLLIMDMAWMYGVLKLFQEAVRYTDAGCSFSGMVLLPAGEAERAECVHALGPQPV